MVINLLYGFRVRVDLPDSLDCYYCSFLIFQTTGLLLSALGNLSAMTDLGDSKDDAESLLEQLKEFTTKSMVSGKTWNTC